MRLPVAPSQYSAEDQARTRQEIDRTFGETVMFGRDIELARGEKLILRSPNGTRFYLTVSNGGVLSATAV